jgi:hypothetical protein
MKHWYIFYSCFFLLFSCTNNNTLKNVSNSEKKSVQGFVLKGTLTNGEASTVYLNKIIGNSLFQIDSASVNNHTFVIQGMVEFPERFALTFDSYAYKTILILENTPIEINIDINNINNPIIKGSPLNNQLEDYKLKAKTIFRKIDYLFPHFQKARLENDIEKLAEIKLEMNAIEQEFQAFSYVFIEKHKNSYIAPIILSDHLKTFPIDTLQIKKTFQLISDDVKNSPDAQQIASFLNLH